MTTCAIVGNAKSIFGKGHGSLIDSHDVVIRINRPDILVPEDQGTKTDIMVVHDLTVKFASPKKHKIINTSKDMRPDLELWSDIMYEETQIENVRPTTGFLAVLYALSLDYDVRLFGFDWYDTPTYYLGDAPAWKRHAPKWEEKQIYDWLHKDVIYRG